jgi:hypothetical protein
MKKYLLAYQIDGHTVGIDLSQWNPADLNGNQPFKIIESGTTIPSGYTDISSIVNWNAFGMGVANDYLVIKNAIRDLVSAVVWSGLTSVEKDISIQYYAYSTDMEAVIYLMTEKGMTQQEAQYFLLQEWHKHHKGVMNTCQERWYYVKLTVPMFLSFNDCENLFSDATVLSLVTQMNEMGLLGTDAGDNRDGIMNFVESTGGFTGNGLKEKGYALEQGTWEIFIQAIKNVMLEGIYDKY